MKLIAHRRNTIAQLQATDPKYGVEVDIRSEGPRLIIHHDPFVAGESFEDPETAETGIPGAKVVQIDTEADTGHVRIYLNDGNPVWDGDPEIKTSDSQALDAIFRAWAEASEDTMALRKIAEILATTGREA